MPFTAETRRCLEYTEEELLQIETEQGERKRGKTSVKTAFLSWLFAKWFHLVLSPILPDGGVLRCSSASVYLAYLAVWTSLECCLRLRKYIAKGLGCVTAR